ncbi:pyridoxamine 5'-phosphate oxidase [Candidatus Velamenicoccus archaeovorus]|uniref:Pyridoxamine 5'-phosphate oxidase n=1 Tax=Velamenicoccus archaeovorus TaxID=1930593 RepID=A0A410P4S7_VELA1|nr:pyridoxamine 5'-phosphate oxidase family protein [Candidatus Velamenicoccus archaeovorus]QAT17217.1 pyridoxamine 5'-phosphate oxidase [Candidatus Velamenicoccus archaeovorus]
MDKQEIIDFIKRNPIVYLATVEGKRPHVRGMMLYLVDENGIIFHTGRTKDLQKQLERNPEVELCCFSQTENKQVRIAGKVEAVRDEALKKEIVKNRPFLKPWIEERGLDFLTVWRIKGGVATIWTMETNLEPKEYIKL